MSTFEKEFLENYLKFGLGSMPKSDIDALVMYLIDKYGVNGPPALGIYGNQDVSGLLKTPVTKIKKLRYDAALKFGGSVEDQAKGRLLAAIGNASLESEGDKVCLIIEDLLAKNWLQGQLKNKSQIFDYSFNTEIIKVSVEGLFSVLETVFGKREIDAFRSAYEAEVKKDNREKLKTRFRELILQFAESAARTAGASVVSAFRAKMGI